MEGRHLGSYRIASLLGAGGMGEVYRAFDERLQRDVALKVLPAANAQDEAARARLLREARAAAALNHPHICTIHDVGEHDGQAFIAMELIDGEPLHRVIPAGTGLPFDRVLTYGLQVAGAMAHAHARGVLHRDLKTQNIIVTKEGRAKVLDFGLAKRLATAADTATKTLSMVTAVGTIAGTPAYMAPEQLRGEPADTRSDIWALGVVLHEMAAGERPFSGDTGFALSSAILTSPARPLPSRVPRELRAFIARCLEKDPADRFQSSDQALAALEGVQAGVVPATLPRLRLSRRAASVAVAGLVLAASAVAVGLNVGGIRERLWSKPPLYDSIAVMPLEDQSGDPAHAYLTTGIQQGLTTELSELPGFTKVIGTGSTRRFRNSTATLTEIARSLDVRALVTGSVTRTADRVEVRAQLIDGADERQVWGQTYTRAANNIASLQKELAAAIAAAIALRLGPDERLRLAEQPTVNPETYELYLRGMHELASVQDGGERVAGLNYLQQAVDRDPGDAHAYAGLARGWVTLGHSPAAPEDAWNNARAAAERAITLAPHLADAHAAMAMVKMYHEWDWEGAEREFRRANQLNPNLAQNHYHYAWFLFLRDRLDEAIVEHERARDVDPMTPANTAWLSVIYTAARRYDDAIATAKKIIERNPRSGAAWQALSIAYSFMDRHDEAIDAAKRAAEFAPPMTFALGIGYARAGRLEEAREVLRTIESRPRRAYTMWARAMLHLYLGNADEFFTAIAFEPHHGWVPWVRNEPPILRFKDDPRYAELFARLKLPPPSERYFERSGTSKVPMAVEFTLVGPAGR
jgi:serine/threonine protein kinase